MIYARENTSIYSNDANVIELGKGYLEIVSISYLITAFINVVNVSLKAIGKASQPMVTTFISLVLNVIFNYIFIFKMGMGVKGAAYGTLCARST